MDWERVLINTGMVFGFFMLMTFWIGLAMWMRIDADKRGLVGWIWIFVGILTGPFGLVAYLLFRANHTVLEVVNVRDELIAENARAHAPQDYDPHAPKTESAPAEVEPAPPSALQAALEAERRHLQG